MPEEPREPLTFSAFVLSLATTAAVHFGDLGEPESGEKQAPNLEAAAQMIDILGMLEDKTKGNLSPDEAQLLEQVLYELRMRFVQVRDANPPSRIIVP